MPKWKRITNFKLQYICVGFMFVVFSLFYLLKELFRRLWVHFIGWSFPSLVWPSLLFPLCWLRLVIQHAHTSCSLEKGGKQQQKMPIWSHIMAHFYLLFERRNMEHTSAKGKPHKAERGFSISFIYHFQLLKFTSFFVRQYFLFFSTTYLKPLFCDK